MSVNALDSGAKKTKRRKRPARQAPVETTRLLAEQQIIQAMRRRQRRK